MNNLIKAMVFRLDRQADRIWHGEKKVRRNLKEVYFRGREEHEKVSMPGKMTHEEA